MLLVSHGFQPNYEKAFANGLARNGIAVKLLGSDRTQYSHLDSNVEAINLRGSQDPTRPKIRKAINLAGYLIKLFGFFFTRRPSTLHLNGLLLCGDRPMALLELALYRLGSKKLLLTVHNIVPHDKNTGASHRILRKLYKIPHLLVVHTEKMRRGLMNEFAIPANHIVVMEHGVDDIPMTTAMPPPGTSLKVLLFGSLMPYKGVDIFLKSLSHCHEIVIEATIAGESRDAAYTTEIEKLIGDVTHPHQVAWIREFIPENEVQSYFERADVVVMPYRHIDQSGVLFTAFRFGTPVICFDVGAFRNYVPEYAGMVVPDQSAKTMAEGLNTFYKQRNAYDRGAIQAYARSFSWESTVRVLLPHLTSQ